MQLLGEPDQRECPEHRRHRYGFGHVGGGLQLDRLEFRVLDDDHERLIGFGAGNRHVLFHGKYHHSVPRRGPDGSRTAGDDHAGRRMRLQHCAGECVADRGRWNRKRSGDDGQRLLLDRFYTCALGHVLNLDLRHRQWERRLLGGCQ